MTLYLIRHGESIANTKRLVTGDHNDILSNKGIEQVNELKILIDKMQIKGDVYITSQWNRAQQTANILSSDVEWNVDNRVGETDAGEVSNYKLDDFLEHYKDFYACNSNSYPSGESHNKLNKRVINWLVDITKNVSKEANVILVAHAGPISCILQMIEDVEMSKFPAFKPANASLTIIEIPNNKIAEAEVVTFSMVGNSD